MMRSDIKTAIVANKNAVDNYEFSPIYSEPVCFGVVRFTAELAVHGFIVENEDIEHMLNQRTAMESDAQSMDMVELITAYREGVIS